MRSTRDIKCLDHESGQVYISRNVVFDESIFPFAKTLLRIPPQQAAAVNTDPTWTLARVVMRSTPGSMPDNPSPPADAGLLYPNTI
jgi:hypothetical protein